MAKEIRTMTGATYVVTMTEAGTVKGVYNAQEIVLVSLEQPGQATFQAISNQTVLSDDAAIVNPTDASALFVGASSGGVSSGQVEAVVQDAIYAGEEVGQWTPSGTDNATCNYFEIAAARSFAGSLNELSYRSGHAAQTGMTTDPLWLAIWEQKSDDDSDYELLGVSKNSLTQALSSTLTWYFDNLRLQGRRLRIVPTTSIDQLEPSDRVNLRVRVSACSDGSGIYYNNAKSNYIPEMMMGGLKLTPRYAAQADVSAHVADTVVHVTAEERSAWNAKADSSALSSKADATVLDAHTSDATAHLTADEHTAITELIESGGGGGSAITIDDNPTSGSSNAVSSGGVYSSLHGSGEASTKVGDAASASQYASVAIGNYARATGTQTTSIGYNSLASDDHGLALGSSTSAKGSSSTAVGTYASAAGMASVTVGYFSSASGDSGVAVGNGASASSASSSAIGSGAYCGDVGVLALNAGGSATDGKSTQLYLIPAGSPMAATYTDGEAGLGYVVLDHLSGSVIAQGVVKLSSVCTDHSSDFAPTNVRSIKDY